MKISIRKGIGFGLTSGIITTLGMIMGLYSGTKSRVIVIAGIFTIAIADAFSDSLGVHISEESGSKSVKEKEIWESTISTFITKFLIALTFLIPIYFIGNISLAIIISIIWGLFLITVFSYYISKPSFNEKKKTILEHLFIAIIVIVLTYIIGNLISGLFKG